MRNFVIFSWNFLPGQDAESWCTARFAGALAAPDRRVKVVTIAREGEIDAAVYAQIAGDGVEVIRVPVRPARRTWWARLRYFTFEWEAIGFAAAIRTLKRVLAETDSPILITRSEPLASTIVGWHCRKAAAKWVVHFSDPVPFPGRDKSWSHWGWGKFYGAVCRRWVGRALREADLVSVTCPNAIRYFREAHPRAAARTRFVLTPHLGEPALSVPGSDKVPADGHGLSIVHHGVLSNLSGAAELALAVRRLNEEGFVCEFVQCGRTDGSDGIFAAGGPVRRAAQWEGDVEYAADFMMPLDYSPMVPSKFVYRLFEDRPLLAYSTADSWMAKLAQAYPEAGIVFADRNLPDSLYSAIKALLERGVTVDRTRIRRLFVRTTVIQGFLEQL